jgi:hypothetical protein
VTHRAALEASLGHTLDHVRIHADQSAHDLATTFAARAFATGRDIYFRGGEFAPETPAGFELLTHEVVHVLQHGDDGAQRYALRISRATDPDELAADALTDAVIDGQPAEVSAATESAPVIARWPWDDDSGGGGSVWDTVSSIGSSVLDFGTSAGKAIGDAESSVVDAVLSHPAAVAESTASLNKSWGGLVDDAKGSLSSASKSAVEATSDIPILGGLVQGGALFADVASSSLAGGAKGLGDLVSGGINAAANPLAPIEGLLGMAEHTPGFAGTMLKGAHGLYDIASGNEKGEYGKDMGELWDNLTDGDKQTDADLKYWAQLGGGEKAWSDDPVDAGARTLTNLLPMLLGEFLGEGPAPRGPGTPVPEPPVSPMAKSVPSSKLPGIVDPMAPTVPDPNLPIVDPMAPTVRAGPVYEPVRYGVEVGPNGEIIRGNSDIPPTQRSPTFPEEPLPPTKRSPTFPEEPLPSTQDPLPSTQDRPMPSTEDPLPSTWDRPVPSTEDPLPSTQDRPMPSTLDRPSPSTLDRPADTQPRPAITPVEHALQLYRDVPEVEFRLKRWDGIRRKGY